LSRIPLNGPLLDGNEKKYLAECVETGWISSEGTFVKMLEDGVAARLGRKYGVAVCNGSAALEAAVAALDIGPGDEVILPTFTIISCAAAIVRAGATPVVVDADAKTWNMRVDLIEPLVTARTKAIMAVHIYGLPVDMDPLLAVASKHGLRVIEDAAEVIGQTYKGTPCGGLGDVSTVSFYPNKLVTTGEGGMLLTNDADVAERARALRNLCFGSEHRFVHESLGWNFRMSNVQAALGVAQLERLEQTVAKKRLIGCWYEALLGDIDSIERAPARMPFADNIWWVYGVVLSDSVPFAASEAIERLAADGIATRPFFWPMHEQPVLRRRGLFEDITCPVAERLGRRGFYLPSGVALSRQQVERVAQGVRKLLA
jgi:perosamine synthetase